MCKHQSGLINLHEQEKGFEYFAVITVGQWALTAWPKT